MDISTTPNQKTIYDARFLCLEYWLSYEL